MVLFFSHSKKKTVGQLVELLPLVFWFLLPQFFCLHKKGVLDRKKCKKKKGARTLLSSNSNSRVNNNDDEHTLSLFFFIVVSLNLLDDAFFSFRSKALAVRARALEFHRRHHRIKDTTTTFIVVKQRRRHHL